MKRSFLQTVPNNRSLLQRFVFDVLKPEHPLRRVFQEILQSSVPFASSGSSFIVSDIFRTRRRFHCCAAPAGILRRTGRWYFQQGDVYNRYLVRVRWLYRIGKPKRLSHHGVSFPILGIPKTRHGAPLTSSTSLGFY